MTRISSLQNFDAYKERESRCCPESVVTPEGTLLDSTDFELRRNPPNVVVDNRTHPSETVITIDSADRPGTLVEVVQCLTELNLIVREAQISSEGGWFVDSFRLEEAVGGKIIDHKKLETIKQVLKIEYESERRSVGGGVQDERWCVHTVLEITDADRVGLLCDTARVVSRAGLDVKSLAAWTQYNRGALVIGAVAENGPLQCQNRTALLKHDLLKILSRDGHVTIKNVRGYIHHERRLHRLLLQETERSGIRHKGTAENDQPAVEAVCSMDSTPKVTVSDFARLKYWRVTICCEDRMKLLFDTLCTLTDLDYDVYHARVETQREQGTASQEFYTRPRFGDVHFDEDRAAKLKQMLISSIQRRAPHGMEVLVLTLDQTGLLYRITDMFKTAGLRMTRAKVKCLTDDMGLPIEQAVHTFYVELLDGSLPNPSELLELLSANGGLFATHLTEDRIPPRMETLQDGFAFNIPDWSLRNGLQESLSMDVVAEGYHQSRDVLQGGGFAVST